MLRLSWGFDNNNNTKNIKTNYFLIRGPIPTTTPVGNRVNFRFKSRLLPWHLASVKDGPRNLRLKFGQYRLSNSWDIADIEFPVEEPRLIWWRATAYMVKSHGLYGVQSHFRFKPNLGYVRLNWGWVVVLTISGPKKLGQTKILFKENKAPKTFGPQNLVKI